MKKIEGNIKGIYIDDKDIKSLFDFINELEDYKIRCEKVKTYLKCGFVIKNISDISKILKRIEIIISGLEEI